MEWLIERNLGISAIYVVNQGVVCHSKFIKITILILKKTNSKRKKNQIRGWIGGSHLSFILYLLKVIVAYQKIK